MKPIFSILLLLPACSAPFTLAEAVSSNLDPSDSGEASSNDALAQTQDALTQAQDAHVVTEVAEGDGGLGAGEAEAGAAEGEADSRSEKGEASVEASEAAPTCTSIPSSTTPSGYCPAGHGSPYAIAPGEFGVVLGSGCPAAQTPTACKWCKETFTCACILAQADIRTICQTSSAAATCDDSTGTPTLVCP